MRRHPQDLAPARLLRRRFQHMTLRSLRRRLAGVIEPTAEKRRALRQQRRVAAREPPELLENQHVLRREWFGVNDVLCVVAQAMAGGIHAFEPFAQTE